MAVYHQNLKYSDDNVEKHAITKDEIEFLKELQKEMNTQDHVGQADPRFWVIKGTEKIYGIEDGYQDDSELYDEDSCHSVANDMKEAVEYITENILDEINEIDGIKRTLTYDEGVCHDKQATLTWFEDGNDVYRTFDNMQELADWLNEYGYSYQVANYCYKTKIYPDTMALTEKDMAEHLRKNYYHYSEDAHTYAMTAWREPRIERLFKILQEVDWGKIGGEKNCVDNNQ